MFDDAAIAWMQDLDWSFYRRARFGVISRRIFLPRLVEMFAEQICAPWPGTDYFLGEAGNPFTPPIVDVDEAFMSSAPDFEKIPVHSHHARFDALVRKEADRFGLPILSADRIEYNEWDAITLEQMLANGDGIGARRALHAVAPIIAEAAMTGKVVTWARPTGGGDDRAEQMTPGMWDLDEDALYRRFAACGLCFDRPHDPDADVDHFIFADAAGLQNTILQSARQNYAPIALDPHIHRLRRRVDYYAVLVEEVEAFLVTTLEKASPAIGNDTLKDLVRAEFGESATGKIFERAKAAAVKHPGLEHFANPGRKKGVPLERKDPPRP